MVVDNADSGASTSTVSPVTPASAASSHRSLSEYLPMAAHGSIAIISCSREVVDGLIDFAEDILAVQPTTKEDAVILLTKRLKGHRKYSLKTACLPW